jgi:hypothetical protein
MANGADNCHPLLTNHKQTPTHEPHCLPCNIIPSSGLQVNYFTSFQTLSADSSVKFVCASQQATYQSPWSAESWTRQVTKNIPCNIHSHRHDNFRFHKIHFLYAWGLSAALIWKWIQVNTPQWSHNEVPHIECRQCLSAGSKYRPIRNIKLFRSVIKLHLKVSWCEWILNMIILI